MAIYRFRKEDLEGALNRNALWAIVYGDMMSYLMILFLLLFAWGMAEENQPEEKKEIEKQYISIMRVLGAEPSPELERRAQERQLNNAFILKLKNAVEGGELGPGVRVVVSEERITLDLGEGVLFDSAKADLKAGAVDILQKVAGMVRDRANEIRVEGHTDTVPIRSGQYETNFELSMARAYAVMRRLQESGISPSRLSGVGYGEYRPIADNSTSEGRARNRRIEISLIREE